MYKTKSRNVDRLRRHARVRTKVSGTAECPRLNVFRSNAKFRLRSLMMLRDLPWYQQALNS